MSMIPIPNLSMTGVTGPREQRNTEIFGNNQSGGYSRGNDDYSSILTGLDYPRTNGGGYAYNPNSGSNIPVITATEAFVNNNPGMTFGIIIALGIGAWLLLK